MYHPDRTLNLFEQLVNKSTPIRQNSAELVTKNRPVDAQKELAKLAGVSHDTIAKYETIKEKSPAETLGMIVSMYVSSGLATNAPPSETAYDLLGMIVSMYASSGPYQNLHQGFLAPGASIAF